MALSDMCPCVYPDIDPDDDAQLCACGHVGDEHDDEGGCTVPVAINGQPIDPETGGSAPVS